MPGMESLALNIQIVSEETLKDITKGPLGKFTLTCDDPEQVNHVWESLKITLSGASLSKDHVAEACNAVSAFVEAAVASPVESTQQLVISTEAWMTIFGIFLARYEDLLPKPLKQLLGSLVTILARNFHGDLKFQTEEAISNEILPSIILGEPKSYLKGSVVALEMLIRKKALSTLRLISLIKNWLSKNSSQWVPVFENENDALLLEESTASVNLKEPSDELAVRIFVLGLITHTSNRSLAGSAAGSLENFLQKLKKEGYKNETSKLWVAPIRHYVLQNLDNIEVLSTGMLPPIFSGDPEGFMSFVQTLPLQSLMAGSMTGGDTSEFILLFAALQIGKKINLVHEDYDPSLTTKSKKSKSKNLVLTSNSIGLFLVHCEPSVRVAALSLLTTAFTTTKPMTSEAAHEILKALPLIHADSDAHSRSEIMSITRKLVVRLRSGIKQIGLPGEDATPATHDKLVEQSKSDQLTLKFLANYVKFLEGDLCVNASYPRHITALKAIKLLLESGLDPLTNPTLSKGDGGYWKIHMELYNASLLRLLLDLLLDPFEEVRQTSLAIINLFPSQVLLNGGIRRADKASSVNMRLPEALSRAEKIASNTSRADHADTVARLYHVLFSAARNEDSIEAGSLWSATRLSVVNTLLVKLEGRLDSAGGLFNSSMREAPLHGYMSGLRYIISTPNFHAQVSANSREWNQIHHRITSICDRIWEEVKPVLCVDSPEGHTDEPLEDISVGPKDILSYSWRALRESSLLLHATISNPTYGPRDDNGLKREDFERIGRSSFTQLAELRHRGAFSTVSQTFSTCCQRCSSSPDPFIQELPHIWYQEAKAIIFESAGQLTRRSAGIPALVTGILASSPNSAFFKSAMQGLFEISRLSVDYDKEEQYLKLPQVHAINSLKDIFTNTKIGPFTEPFIMTALTLSAERLGSPIWALRNSGLMLFRALLTRICRLTLGTKAGFGGVSGAEPGAKISFPKYPGLMELLSKLLASGAGNTGQEGSDIVTERIFPALELIGEKIPSPEDNTDKVLRDLVLEHLKSPLWGIREHASRVYASLMIRGEILTDLQTLLGFLNAESTENFLHGVALCFRYSLRRFAATADAFWISHIDELMKTIRLAFDTILAFAKSPFVAAVLIEVLNDTMDRSMEAESEARVLPSINEIFSHHELDDSLSHVFDTTKQGWNLSPVTRSSSLLRRAFAWFLTLQKLASHQENLHEIYIGFSLFDPDAASWVCEQLQERLGEKRRFQKPLANLYSAIILGNHAADTKTIAVSNLASVVGSAVIMSPNSLNDLDIPSQDLLRSFQPEKDIQKWNRHATDAELRLRGALLAIEASPDRPGIPSDFEANIVSWTVKLRSALSEETEFTTRLAAVASLQSFAQVLHPESGEPRTDPLFLDLYLILYDLLNDDDDEIRDIAAATASRILSYSREGNSRSVIVGPLKASSLLAEFIMVRYSDSMHFARRVIRYLTGQEVRISGSNEQTRLVPVSELIMGHRQESTVLFVEEKQNLFIDEVREVRLWAKALLYMKSTAPPEGLIRQISRWVSEGLVYIHGLISQEPDADGLLGWVSKPESFTLGVRVIAISSALIQPRFPGAKSMEIEPRVLRNELDAVRQAGESASVHSVWLEDISSGLNAVE